MLTKLRYTKMFFRTMTLESGKVLVLKKDAPVTLDSKEMKEKDVKKLIESKHLKIVERISEKNTNELSDTTKKDKSDKNKKKEDK